MVIRGSDPNLVSELQRSESRTGFSDPDLFDHFARSGHSLLTPPLSDDRQFLWHGLHATAICAGTR